MYMCIMCTCLDEKKGGHGCPWRFEYYVYLRDGKTWSQVKANLTFDIGLVSVQCTCTLSDS